MATTPTSSFLTLTTSSLTFIITKAHMQNIALAKNVNIGGEYLTNVALSKDTIDKSFPISIDSEEYTIIGTGKCNAIAHKKDTNPYCAIIDQSANIKNIRIYKEQLDSNETKQIDIYTAQVETIENTNDSQATPQDNQNLIALEASFTNGILTKDIHLVYYVKYRNESLWE